MCKKALVVVILLVFAFSQFMLAPKANAGGFLFPEQGQPSVGTASAGQAALADDASTTFFNPAGMARLKKTDLMLAGQGMVTVLQFKPDDENTATGTDGGHAGGIYPGGGFYYSIPLTDRFSAGICMNAPSALGLNYDDSWMGRYMVHRVFFVAANINPVMSFRVNDWLSFGAGVSAIYGVFHEEIALPTVLPGRKDGNVSLKLDDWAAGYNLGVLIEPGALHEALEGTRIGVAYRSQVELNLHGQPDISNFGPGWIESQLQNAFASTELVLPRNLTASVYQPFLDNFALLLDFGWADFSSMKETLISTASGMTVDIPRNWVDTWRLGAGLHYRMSDQLLLKCGFSYDSSPVKNRTDGMPDMPLDRQLRYAGGFEWHLSEDMKISSNYEFIDLGKAPMTQPYGAGLPTLSGDYDKNSAHVFNISFNWKFDGPFPGMKPIRPKTIDK